MCVAVTLLFALDRGLTAGEIHTGVEVESVKLGGKTVAEARELLEYGPARSVEKVVVTGPRDDVRFTAGEMGIGLDVTTTLERAYAVGREGSPLGRLGQRIEAALGGTSVSPQIVFDPEAAGANTKRLVSDLREEPEEARVTVAGDAVVEVGEAKVGREVDLRATVENVTEAAEEGWGEASIVVRTLDPEVSTAEAEDAAARAERAMSGPVVLTAAGEEWILSPAEVGQALKIAPAGGRMEVSLDEERLRESLQGVYAGLTVEPVEAEFVVRGGEVSIEESRDGKRIEEEELLEMLETGLFEGRRRFEIPLVTDEPELTSGEAEDAKPTALLGRYRTNYLTYDDNPGRIENLEIASDAVSGTTLAPGEVFSFNRIAEPLAYYETQVIIDGQVDYSEGGGLCQVASTLYMAANYAGLKTIERHPHYSELPYIRPGFDATVWFGSLDLKFKNNTDGYVLLREWVDEDGYVNAEVWGQPTGKEVEMRSELVSTSTDIEGNPVTEWVTYRKVTRGGEVVSDGPIHTDA